MPNFTGVIANARFVFAWVALNRSISAFRCSTSPAESTSLQHASSRSACRTGIPYGVLCCGW